MAHKTRDSISKVVILQCRFPCLPPPFPFLYCFSVSFPRGTGCARVVLSTGPKINVVRLSSSQTQYMYSHEKLLRQSTRDHRVTWNHTYGIGQYYRQHQCTMRVLHGEWFYTDYSELGSRFSKRPPPQGVFEQDGTKRP